jgi:hypothetical protein
MSAPAPQESPRDAFARLIGLGTDQRLADAEIQALMAIKKKLKLDGTDAMWEILQALHYYDRLYRTYPGLIKDSAVATLEKFKQAASAEAENAKTTVQKSLTDAVTAASKDIAVNTARKELARQIVIGLVIGVVLAIGAAGFAFWKGTESGYNKGLSEASEQKAAASWANTESGRTAYKLWKKNGDLEDLANCSAPGWKLAKSTAGKTICEIGPDADGKTHWWYPIK